MVASIVRCHLWASIVIVQTACLSLQPTPQFTVHQRSTTTLGAVEERCQISNDDLAGPMSNTDTDFDVQGRGSVERPFPLSLIHGFELVKQALILACVNHRVGGVVISGSKGTAKSVMARAVHNILPPIEVLKGSLFNIDPEGELGLDDGTLGELVDGGVPLQERDKEVIQCPFVQVPVNVMEDHLLGYPDMERSMKKGKPVFSPGLLSKAHRGVLCIDDINLLDEKTLNILLSVISDGFVSVERESVSFRYPCRPLVIATFNPDEGGLPGHVLDRLALFTSTDILPLDTVSRSEAVDNVLSFASQGLDKPGTSDKVTREALEAEDEIMTSIILAREYLRDLKISTPHVKYLCEVATRAGCEGHRAEIFAAEVALASAALQLRQVNEDDLKVAIDLAIAPRGSVCESAAANSAPPPMDDRSQPPITAMDTDRNANSQQGQSEAESPCDSPIGPDAAREYVVESDATTINPELLQFGGVGKGGKGRRHGLVFGGDRGRYVKPMIPEGKISRVAVEATLRAAAPHQRYRREQAVGTEHEGRSLHLRQSDVRVKKLATKAGSLILFVVDASGSMALNRMNAAKGAALSLLKEAYKCRDQIALVVFQGERSSVLLPPTRSISTAKRRLERMPCGGGSPMAHAIQTAMVTGTRAQEKSCMSDVVVVLISDGRANVPLQVSRGETDDGIAQRWSRESLQEEVLLSARKLGVLPGFHLLCIDTESKFLSTGFTKEIADAAQGKYHRISKANEKEIESATSLALKQITSTKGGGSF